jgi:hypothetical protein
VAAQPLSVNLAVGATAALASARRLMPSSILRRITNWKGCSRAPPSRAVAKNRSGSRMASMVASGTNTAARSAGFSPGSRASAWGPA